MKKTLTKKQAQEKIDEFFENIKGKSEKQVKKIKRLAMKYNIPLGDYRKTYCKKCLSPYEFPKIRIKKGVKHICCEKCGAISRWKLK